MHFEKSYCLVWILGRRPQRSIFFLGATLTRLHISPPMVSDILDNIDSSDMCFHEEDATCDTPQDILKRFEGTAYCDHVMFLKKLN